MEKTEIAKWEKTKTQFLLRNTESGIYYGRAYAQGKEVWKSLKTDVASVARARLSDFLAELRKVDCFRAPAQSLRARLHRKRPITA